MQCARCKRSLAGRRADAYFCLSACRAKAHRERVNARAEELARLVGDDLTRADAATLRRALVLTCRS